jgi:membrane-bound lytic murein transglycosylase B
MKSPSALRRHLEIVVLEVIARVLRLRAPRMRTASHRRQPRWIAAGAALLLPSLAVGSILVQRASAHSASQRPSSAVAAQPAVDEPEPPRPQATIDPALFDAAAKRAPASPALQRLPQVDLNGLSVAGIPRAALAAYVTAARLANRQDTSCHVRWWLLAGIGLVESGHAHSGGSARPAWNGIAKPPIFGPRLDGKHGYAAIRDTDRGKLDADRAWDRAVGPMQFLPSTWQTWGGTTRKGPRDPQDIRAATLAAARYLCAGSADLSQAQGMATAVYSYNHSFDYVRLVLTVASRYAGIDPNALGVDRLPHDKAAQKTKKKGAAKPAPSQSPTASPAGHTAPVASPTPSGGGGGGASSSPTPTPGAGGGGGPSLPPVPTPSPFGHKAFSTQP